MSERIESTDDGEMICSWCGRGNLTWRYGADGQEYGECDSCNGLEIIYDDEPEEPAR